MSGQGSPWSAQQNREACVDAFLAAAQCHFLPEVNEKKINTSQQKARQQMIALLNGEWRTARLLRT